MRRIAILSSLVYHKITEIHGEDRIVWGGAERYLIELCNLLNADGWEVDIYQGINPADADMQKLRQTKLVKRNFRGFNVFCLSAIDTTASVGVYPMLNATFNEYCDDYDLRIYYVTNLCYPEVRLPAISISHGIFWDFPNAIQNIHLFGEAKEEFFSRQLYGFTAPNLCVAVDSNVKNVIRAMYPGKENRIIGVPNFVDTSAFAPKRVEDKEKLTVLFPRRFVSIRGSNDFLKASRGYHNKYDFLAVGQPNDFRAEGRMGQHTSLKWTYAEPEDMPELYNNADISVIPTKSTEGLSLSLLESLACGLPTICTLNGGLSTGVIPDYNCVPYDPDFQDLGELIDELASDRDKMNYLSVNARETAKAFDIAKWKANWLSLLRGF